MIKTIRCPQCRRKLIEIEGYAIIKCDRCKSIVEIDTKFDKVKKLRQKQYVRENTNHKTRENS